LIRLISFLAVAALLALPPAQVSAQEKLSQLQLSVQRVLRSHNLYADVRTLSPAQLSAINSIGHSNRSHSSRRSLIRSSISGQGYRLRDLLNWR
jgi:hypothetical protein